MKKRVSLPYDDRIAIEFDRVDKVYKLYKNDRGRVLSLLSDKVPAEKVYASNSLSFIVEKGESVALIGHNGSGKSTTLKMITGVCYPTKGNVIVNGRVSALLELTAGFDMNLTGMENLYMKGQIWGLSRDEMDALTPGIVEFADLGAYINQPVKMYSSGMRSRLGFAFASSVDADILIVDEVLAVGDRDFSRKCQERVKELLSTKKDMTVLFVTHSASLARRFCDRGLVLDKGHVVYDGYIEDALRFYEHGRNKQDKEA